MKFSSEAQVALTTRWYPYRRWFNVLTDGTVDFNNYYYICFNCFAGLKVQSDDSFAGFNALLGSLPLESRPNPNLPDNLLDMYKFDKRNAMEVAEEIFANYCVVGVMVIAFELIEHLRSYSYDAIISEFNGDWKLVIWSKQGFCEKNGASRPDDNI